MDISTAISIGITILIFGVVVLVHEWGHFIAARKNGILVEEFAIGMGPKLFGYQKGEGETLYSLRLFPIGGFCRMLGEDEAQPDNPLSFGAKNIPRRMSVMLAGAFMNFALAFLIFLGVGLYNGITLPVVLESLPGTPAAQAGLRTGDRITHFNDTRVRSYDDFYYELSLNGGKSVELRVLRDGQRHTLSLTPYRDEQGAYKLGFYPDARVGLGGDTSLGYRRIGVWESITAAFQKILFFIKVTIVGLARLVTRSGSLAEVAGPIGFFGIIDDSYQATIAQSVAATVLTMLNLCALLSANLGVFNLLPLPALDGGRMAFLLFEGIRRKPIPQEREGMVHFVGFVLLILLAVFIAFQDIRKLL